MKKIITAILIFTCLFTQAQVKDTVIYKPDSVATVSITDMNTCLKYIEDKVTKKEYDMYMAAYQLLLQLTEPKRRITKPKNK